MTNGTGRADGRVMTQAARLARIGELLGGLPPAMAAHPSVAEAIALTEPGEGRTVVQQLDDMAGAAATKLEEATKEMAARVTPALAGAADAGARFFGGIADRVRGVAPAPGRTAADTPPRGRPGGRPLPREAEDMDVQRIDAFKGRLRGAPGDPDGLVMTHAQSLACALLDDGTFLVLAGRNEDTDAFASAAMAAGVAIRKELIVEEPLLVSVHAAAARRGQAAGNAGA